MSASDPEVDIAAMPDVPWQEFALCRQLDADLWHAEDSAGVAQARRLCLLQCPVVAECLFMALSNREELGVWGGTTPAWRRKVWDLDEWPRVPECHRGHEYTQENTTTRKDGTLRCRACDREGKRSTRALEKEREAA